MKMKIEKNFLTMLDLTALLMFLIFIIKCLSVLFYSSRNINLGFPYDAFGFEPFHRFTDYLLLWDITSIKNIYDLNEPIYKALTPAPYGFIQFSLLKFLPFRDLIITKYLNFILILIAFIFINFKIYYKNLSNFCVKDLLVFLIIFTLNYPIFFIIDRGNLDIYGATIIALLIYRITCVNCSKDNIINSILIAILIGLKPSFLLYYFVLLFYFNWKCIVISTGLILSSYAIPIIFYGAEVNYLLFAITNAKTQLGLPAIFCNNLSCAIRAAGANPNVYFSTLFGAISFFYFIYYFIKVCKALENKRKIYTLLFIATVATMVVNDPSPDYRLIFLLPFFISIGFIINLENISKFYFLSLVVSICLIFSFTNIYIKNYAINYFVILRFLGMLIFFQILLNQVIKYKAETTSPFLK
jgi:hypothetical protein